MIIFFKIILIENVGVQIVIEFSMTEKKYRALKYNETSYHGHSRDREQGQNLNPISKCYNIVSKYSQKLPTLLFKNWQVWVWYQRVFHGIFILISVIARGN